MFISSSYSLRAAELTTPLYDQEQFERASPLDIDLIERVEIVQIVIGRNIPHPAQ